MRLFTLTATEHVTHDNRGTGGGTTWCYTVSGSYRHHRVLLDSANFTAAIDVTSHRAVIDVDSRSTSGIIYTIAVLSYHGFVTEEVVIITHATSEHITNDVSTHDGRRMLINISRGRVIVNRCQGYRCSRTNIHRWITDDVCSITTAIDITDDAQVIGVVCRRKTQ